MTERLSSLQKRLGVKFRDSSLLRQAIIHRSYLNEHPDVSEDNERLEFLGDAILDFVTAAFLFGRYPDLSEGQLTRLRAALVRTKQLAALARRFGLGDSLLLGKGEADAGGRNRDPILCAAFEAIVGALYVDAGIGAVQRFVEPLIEPVTAEIIARQADIDGKSLLQEWAQATLGETPHYRTVAEAGPDHAKQFTVEVLIGGKSYGAGRGPSKQRAAQAAAAAALQSIDT